MIIQEIKNFSIANSKRIAIILAIFVWLVFFYISIKSPVAGDAWNYAIVGDGSLKNAFIAATEACSATGWSSRFLSELYGFLFCSRHILWSILNASLFAAIYIYIYIY